MKTLLLLRHAKSSWDDVDLADLDRPLNAHGLAAAAYMGELISSQGLLPEMIVCSPARRALQTGEILKESGRLDAPIRPLQRIYEASPHTLYQVAAEFDDKLSSVMMIGHNPGFEGFIGFLTGTIEPMPTAALAVIDLDLDRWRDLKSCAGRMVEVIRPKEAMLRNAEARTK